METLETDGPATVAATSGMKDLAGELRRDETTKRRRAAAKRRQAASQRVRSHITGHLGMVVAVSSMGALNAGAIFATRSGAGQALLCGFVVVVLASLPGWLFIRFMVLRAGSLWTEYVLNLHRLGIDEHQNLPRPPATSVYYEPWAAGGGARLASSQSLYRQKFKAYYGQVVGPDDPKNDPLSLRNLPPVLLATAVFAAGWCAVLARDPLLTGPLQLPLDSLRFGFMGAYVFIVQMLIRRFFQRDMKPSAYFAAVARVATVLVVVLVVDKVAPALGSWSPAAALATAFLIGFFPLLGVQIVQKIVSLTFRHWIQTLQTPYPLSDLDGLNIWYEARLLEEGIEDLQNLVTGDLVDIILHTRVPVERLVDWIDQAALQLLVDPPAENSISKRPRTDRNILRRLGVRTATDLETMFQPGMRLAQRTSRSPVAGGDDEFVKGMRTVLNTGAAGPSVTEALLRNFANTPNLVFVRHWRDTLATRDLCTAGVLDLVDPEIPILQRSAVSVALHPELGTKSRVIALHHSSGHSSS